MTFFIRFDLITVLQSPLIFIKSKRLIGCGGHYLRMCYKRTIPYICRSRAAHDLYGNTVSPAAVGRWVSTSVGETRMFTTMHHLVRIQRMRTIALLCGFPGRRRRMAFWRFVKRLDTTIYFYKIKTNNVYEDNLMTKKCLDKIGPLYYQLRLLKMWNKFWKCDILGK